MFPANLWKLTFCKQDWHCPYLAVLCCVCFGQEKIRESFIFAVCQSSVFCHNTGVRDSAKFLANQDWHREGSLARFDFLPVLEESNGGRQSPSVLAAHNLAGDVHNINQVLHGLRRKMTALKWVALLLINSKFRPVPGLNNVGWGLGWDGFRWRRSLFALKRTHVGFVRGRPPGTPDLFISRIPVCDDLCWNGRFHARLFL